MNDPRQLPLILQAPRGLPDFSGRTLQKIQDAIAELMIQLAEKNLAEPRDRDQAVHHDAD